MESETAQWKIERIIIDNLPDNYKYAKLEEITRSSILLENSVRLPILGKRCRIHERESRLTKEASKLESRQDSRMEAKLEEFEPYAEQKKFSGYQPVQIVDDPKSLVENPARVQLKTGGSITEDEGTENIALEKIQANKPGILPDINKEVGKEEGAEKNNPKEDSGICEKILKTIQAEYGNQVIKEESPSPIKKSKQEHQRLVSKLKYQIPEEWQRPFNKQSFFDARKKGNFAGELGRVNKVNESLWKQIGDHAKMAGGPIKAFPGEKGRHVPLSNRRLVESLAGNEGANKAEKLRKELGKSLMEATKGTADNKDQTFEEGNYVMDDMIEKLKDYQHLLTKEDLKKLSEMGINMSSPLDFGLFLAELKNKFNQKYKSPYLDSLGIVLPYRSKRHDMGGVIEEKDWGDFYNKLIGLADRVKKKRKRIIAFRKKRGKTLMPRKYIYKPPRRPNLSNNTIIIIYFRER